MARIYVFGLGDKSKDGFPNEEALVEYLREGLFIKNDGRFRFNQRREDATVIVLSRDGLAFGHLGVESTEPPGEDDRQRYLPVTWVYVIDKSCLYVQPVRLFDDVGIRVGQFPKQISEDEFQKILILSGEYEEFKRTARQ